MDVQAQEEIKKHFLEVLKGPSPPHKTITEDDLVLGQPQNLKVCIL